MPLRPIILGNVGTGPIVAVQNIGLTATAQQELKGTTGEKIKLGSVGSPLVDSLGGKHAVLGLNEEAPQVFDNASADKDANTGIVELGFVLSAPQQR